MITKIDNNIHPMKLNGYLIKDSIVKLEWIENTKIENGGYTVIFKNGEQYLATYKSSHNDIIGDLEDSITYFVEKSSADNIIFRSDTIKINRIIEHINNEENNIGLNAEIKFNNNYNIL